MFRSLHRRRDPLIPQPQIPPGLVVVRRSNLTGEHSPAPPVDHEAERQEGDLVHRLAEKQSKIGRGRRLLVEESDLHEIVGSDGEGDRVTHRLVEAIIRAVLVEKRLRVVRPLIEVVPQLVMDRGEGVGGSGDAHLHAQVVLIVDIPGAGVAHHVAIARFEEQRSFPEGLRQGSEAE